MCVLWLHDARCAMPQTGGWRQSFFGFRWFVRFLLRFEVVAGEKGLLEWHRPVRERSRSSAQRMWMWVSMPYSREHTCRDIQFASHVIATAVLPLMLLFLPTYYPVCVAPIYKPATNMPVVLQQFRLCVIALAHYVHVAWHGTLAISR